MYTPPQNSETLQEVRDPDGRLLLRVNAGNFRRLHRLLRHDEVCGVVSGTAGPEPAFEDFTPISIPWTPNARGLLEVDQAILNRLLAPFPSTIGYFRCVRQSNVEISAEDYRLMKLIFGEKGGLLILIQSAMFRVNVLHVYSREADTDLRLLWRFPLYDPEAEVPVVGPNAAPPAATSAPAPPTPTLKRRPPVQVFRALAVAALAAILGLLGYEGWHRFSAPHKPPVAANKPVQPEVQPTSPPLDLTLRRIGRNVELRWDPTAEPVRNATRGALTIFDNNTDRKVNLTRGKVQGGRYWYTPRSEDLLFQLVVYQPDNTFAIGTIVGGAGTRSATPAEPAPTPAVTAPPSTTAPVGPAPQQTGNAAPSTAVPAPPPPAAITGPAPAVSTPPVAPTATPPATSAPVNEEPVVPAPPRESPPSRSVAFVGPVPVRRPTPVVPADVRALLGSPVAVRVMVHVDAEGKVTSARILEEKDAPKLVLPYALQAAKLWRFQPARRDGVAAESDTVIFFRFGAQ